MLRALSTVTDPCIHEVAILLMFLVISYVYVIFMPLYAIFMTKTTNTFYNFANFTKCSLHFDFTQCSLDKPGQTICRLVL